jgi:type I restriction enzyme, R subunit
VKPEARARQKIDQLLAAAGWNVQHFEQLNLSAAVGVAVREFPLKSGLADYLLFIDRFIEKGYTEVVDCSGTTDLPGCRRN